MTQSIARKILELMPYNEALKYGDVLERCSVLFYLPVDEVHYRFRWYATYNYYDGRIVRVEVARRWGKSFRRIDDVSYETLQLVWA